MCMQLGGATRDGMLGLVLGAGAAVAAVAMPAGVAAGQVQVVYQTNAPGGFFGPIGFDVSTSQSVAVRFVPSVSVRLHAVKAYFMSNDFAGGNPATVQISLETDTDPPGEYVSIPSGTSLETRPLTVSAVGWVPTQEAVLSVTQPVLSAGTRYWVVARSVASPGDNPVWVWAGEDTGFNANTSGNVWQSGQSAVVSVRVEGTPVPVACGASDVAGPGQTIGADGGLSADDIIVYLNWFFGSDARADVAGPGQATTPDAVFTADDIIVFLNRFFAGC